GALGGGLIRRLRPHPRPLSHPPRSPPSGRGAPPPSRHRLVLFLPESLAAHGGLEFADLGGRPARPAARRAAWEAKPLEVWLPGRRGKQNRWRFGLPAGVGSETLGGLASPLAWEAKPLEVLLAGPRGDLARRRGTTPALPPAPAGRGRRGWLRRRARGVAEVGAARRGLLAEEAVDQASGRGVDPADDPFDEDHRRRAVLREARRLLPRLFREAAGGERVLGGERPLDGARPLALDAGAEVGERPALGALEAEQIEAVARPDAHLAVLAADAGRRVEVVAPGERVGDRREEAEEPPVELAPAVALARSDLLLDERRKTRIGEPGRGLRRDPGEHLDRGDGALPARE